LIPIEGAGGTTWPAWSPDLNITENVLLAIILKLHIETGERNPVKFGSLYG